MRSLSRYTRRNVWWHRLMSRHLASADYRIERYGSVYGGWHVPVELIRADWIIYTFGLGEDASFDLALIDKHGCRVQAFDPTPKAIAYAATIQSPNFIFRPMGAWHCDASIKFHLPARPEYASYSALNIYDSDDYVDAEVRSIRSLAEELGHSKIDLLKLDIEGAEQLVIPNMLADGIKPTVFCVEYDQPYQPLSLMSWRCFRASLRLNGDLLRAGYQLVSKSGWNATYLYPPNLA